MVNSVGNRRESLLASGEIDPKSPAEKAITSWIHWEAFLSLPAVQFGKGEDFPPCSEASW